MNSPLRSLKQKKKKNTRQEYTKKVPSLSNKQTNKKYAPWKWNSGEIKENPGKSKIWESKRQEKLLIVDNNNVEKRKKEGKVHKSSNCLPGGNNKKDLMMICSSFV